MTNSAASQSRAAGALLLGTSALSVLGMLHHPTSQGRGQAMLESLAAIGPLAAAVHGALLTVMLAQLVGQAGLATRLGWGRLVVQGAFIAQAAGGLALTGAAVINGFTFSALAQRMLDAGFTRPDQVKPVLWMLFGQARGWEQIGTGAWAIALLLWGVSVWPQQRWLGLAALVLALVPLVGGLGLLPLGVIGFGAVVASLSIWTAAAGVLLLRGQLGPSDPAP